MAVAVILDFAKLLPFHYLIQIQCKYCDVDLQLIDDV